SVFRRTGVYGSAGVVREEPGQGADGPVLEGLDGALVLAHDPGGLGDGQALEKPERDAFLLLAVESSYGFEEGGAGQGLESGMLGGSLDLVGVERLPGGDLEAEAAGLEVVGDQVAGDGHQPGAEVASLPGEGADTAQRPQ